MDAFERNLETAQLEAGTEPSNFVLVMYKNEVEAASIPSFMLSLVIIGGWNGGGGGGWGVLGEGGGTGGCCVKRVSRGETGGVLGEEGGLGGVG